MLRKHEIHQYLYKACSFAVLPVFSPALLLQYHHRQLLQRVF